MADKVHQVISAMLQEWGLEKQQVYVILRNNARNKKKAMVEDMEVTRLGFVAYTFQLDKVYIVFTGQRLKSSPSSNCTLKMSVLTLWAQFYIIMFYLIYMFYWVRSLCSSICKINNLFCNALREKSESNSLSLFKIRKKIESGGKKNQDWPLLIIKKKSGSVWDQQNVIGTSLQTVSGCKALHSSSSFHFSALDSAEEPSRNVLKWDIETEVSLSNTYLRGNSKHPGSKCSCPAGKELITHTSKPRLSSIQGNVFQEQQTGGDAGIGTCANSMFTQLDH